MRIRGEAYKSREGTGYGVRDGERLAKVFAQGDIGATLVAELLNVFEDAGPILFVERLELRG